MVHAQVRRLSQETLIEAAVSQMKKMELRRWFSMCTCIHMQSDTLMNMHTQKHKHKCTQAHMHIHIYTHVPMNAHMLTHMHTHTNASLLWWFA